MNDFNILELNPHSRIHFIGIGGISMSALAEILHNMNFIVSGSDINSSNLTKKLSNDGIKIQIGHSSSNVEDADVVVYTAAVKEDNPEMIRAKDRGIPIVERPVLLGEIMRKYKYGIGVSGTHGKTTTTSMVSLILLEAGLDPTITVGGELDLIGGNLRVGKSEYFVTEACEYVESFLSLHPFLEIILNIDADHLDYFKDLEDVTEAFVKFAKLIPKEGYLIANNDDSSMSKVIQNVNCNVITFALKNNATYTAKNIVFNQKGYPQFDIYKTNENIGKICLNIPGTHNIYNALAAIASSISLGASFEHCKKALYKFTGTKRRFEYKGQFDNVTVIDDYAHHPAEVQATLKAAKNYPHNRIWCIFQPHTYTRTQKLLNEFSQSFDDADKVIITDIYAAREKDTGEIHSKDLVKKLMDKQKDVLYFQDFNSICSYISDNAIENDLIITMGAGDIYKVGDRLVKKPNETNKKEEVCVNQYA